MKLAARKRDLWIYSMTDRERLLFQEMLDLYPQVPDTHHRLTAGAVSESWAEQQRLLEESMMEHRQENKRRLLDMLGGGGQFKKGDEGPLLEVSSEQREMLLQLFNDVRVGFWLQLGSPEEEDKIKLCEDAANIPKLMAMEFCAAFQMMLLSGK